ncbi:putative bifunctional diguanylate cyclase/phosphodiesterase [Rubrivivax rivuli]|uniref:EAL domain-containing protein n=1 Tax=Rubrivivax rivuli TaxID=1862385 RepID=A0A437RKF9_9BURK|nr:EAL domain-containing protein [Rubrivivax rivuli]RVU47238.1 EAL domain-containing protein [Rubrivivax rivuli]
MPDQSPDAPQSRQPAMAQGERRLSLSPGEPPALSDAVPPGPAEVIAFVPADMNAVSSVPADPERAVAYQRHCAAIVESSDDAIISKSLDGIVESWNPAAERLFGYSAAEMIGQPMTCIFPPERLAEEAYILEHLRQGERVLHFETVRRSKSGRQINVSVSISPIFDDSGRIVGASKIARDITERFRNQHVMWLQSNYDSLTGMPKRALFEERLDQLIAEAPAQGARLAVLYIDLDHFKQVNDGLGRIAGDQVIAAAAGRIRDGLRDTDSVARLGGDEFVVLLSPTASGDEIERVAKHVMEQLREPIQIETETVYISCSIGCSMYPQHGADAEELVRHADLAMFDAKTAGRNRLRFFAQPLEVSAQEQLKLGAALRTAVAQHELKLVYQPVVCLRTGQVHKCEALIRWHHPERGLVSPAQFIPLAESTGAIRDIGDWVFHEVTRQLQLWQARFGPDFQVSLNVSPLQLAPGAQDVGDWVRALRTAGVAGKSMVVEITESLMVQPEAGIAARLHALREAGVQLAIDDFGTGYSNLNNLSQMDLSFLKVDQSFTRRLGQPGRDHALVEAIVGMARSLGLQVIAEGVETKEQEAVLRELGCDYGQGYLYARPMPAPELERYIARQRAARPDLA